MYDNITLRVKCMSSLSDLFSCDGGLFLFALFINNIEINLPDNLNDGISIDQLQLYLLMFADDAVLFSETREGQQNHLINLSINVPKTKIVSFRKGGNLSQNDKWFYAGEVEVVNSFAYFGVIFSSGGSFIPNTKTLSGKLLKTMHRLLQLLHEVYMPMNIVSNLFDSLVASVPSYGCEVWGFINAECIERIHRKFCKYIINVKQTTNKYALYSELGRYP